MIKILHTADWHIGDFTGPTEDGQNVRARDTRACIEKVIETAAEEKPDIVMVSGDIFHQARVWGNRALDEVGYAIQYISDLSLHAKLVVVMRGTPNHDGEEQFNMLEQYFENVPYVEIVTEPKIVHAIDMDMADNKIYYYLKLKEDFFGSPDMKLLEGMKDGYLYSNILLKMYLLSLRQDGRLMYRGIIPYTAYLTNRKGTADRLIRTATFAVLKGTSQGYLYQSAYKWQTERLPCRH